VLKVWNPAYRREGKPPSVELRHFKGDVDLVFGKAAGSWTVATRKQGPAQTRPLQRLDKFWGANDLDPFYRGKGFYISRVRVRAGEDYRLYAGCGVRGKDLCQIQKVVINARAGAVSSAYYHKSYSNHFLSP
jgi:hypothetical protein